MLVDQLEHVEETSLRRGDGYVNLALLTDACAPSASRGSRSTSPIARSLRRAGASSSRTRRPRPVHAQHGHRRSDGRARRCSSSLDARQGRRRADPPPLVHRHGVRDPTSSSPVNKIDLVDFSAQRFAEIEVELAEARRPAGASTTRRRFRSPRFRATMWSRPRRVDAVVRRLDDPRASRRRSRSPATATSRTGASRCNR